MAINETMSNPSEWIQFYQSNAAQIPPPPFVSAASIDNRLIRPDHGRISKPIRRRSRASRRTPTTLFNTDTTNFRAMVQQFTGGPTSSFAARAQLPDGGATFGFDAVGTQQIGGATTAMAPESGFHLQYPDQQQVFMMNQLLDGGGSSFSSHAPQGPSFTNDLRDYSSYML